MKNITLATWYFGWGISWWIEQTIKHAEHIVAKLGQEVRQVDKEAKHLLYLCRKEQERIDTLTSEQRRLESHMNSEMSVRKARGVFDDMEQYHHRYERSNRLSGGDQRKLILDFQREAILASRKDQGRFQSRYFLMSSLVAGLVAHQNIFAAFITFLARLPRLCSLKLKQLGYSSALETYDFSVLLNEF